MAHYAALGVRVKRLITYKGAAHRSRAVQQTCQALGIKHSFIGTYRPRTNGKAERFIQTCLRERAYVRVWVTSEERRAWLPRCFASYTTRRLYSALNYQPPAFRISGNNLLQLDTSVDELRSVLNSPTGRAIVAPLRKTQRAMVVPETRGAVGIKNLWVG